MFPLVISLLHPLVPFLALFEGCALVLQKIVVNLSLLLDFIVK
jgi:hypothetical protein